MIRHCSPRLSSLNDGDIAAQSYDTLSIHSIACHLLIHYAHLRRPDRQLAIVAPIRKLITNTHFRWLVVASILTMYRIKRPLNLIKVGLRIVFAKYRYRPAGSLVNLESVNLGRTLREILTFI